MWTVIVKTTPTMWLSHGMFETRAQAEAWAKKNYPETIWYVAAHQNVV